MFKFTIIEIKIPIVKSAQMILNEFLTIIISQISQISTDKAKLNL